MLNNLRRKTNLCAAISKQLLIYNTNHTENALINTSVKTTVAVINAEPLPNDNFVTFEKKSVLEKCTEDISHVAPHLKPTFNFAAYVNKSETLKQLVKLGVNLYKLEQKAKVPEFILKLDFEKDIKKYILFLHDIGLTVDEIGDSFTKNPYLLEEDIDNLKVRINYLLYKKFNEEMILRIVSRNPFWLMFSTVRIDRRLGFFQQEYGLTGNEIRLIASKQPKLITYNIEKIKLNNFALKEEMGFSAEELKQIILKKPKILVKNQKNMINTYEYLVNEMKIPLSMLVEWPELLTCRHFRLKQRHLFLETLRKAQYNPKLPNYISPLTLVSGIDPVFAADTAKSSLQAFNAFLKTL